MRIVRLVFLLGISISLMSCLGFSVTERYYADLSIGDPVPEPVVVAAPVVRVLPTGSYSKVCSGCTLSGDVMTCFCNNENGFSRRATLNYRYCNSPVSFYNGTLMCGEPAPRPVIVRTLPSGSYSQTCSACTISGDTLSCNCRNEDGFSRYTSINTRHCYHPVSNQNGRLTCGEPARRPVVIQVPTPAPQPVVRALPSGSYSETCSGCTISGDTLSCQCKTESGYSRYTSLNTRYCGRSVSNQNGSLSCGEPARAPEPIVIQTPTRVMPTPPRAVPAPTPVIPAPQTAVRALPQGSYMGSCSGCAVSENRLSCSCNMESGRPTGTSLSLFGCFKSIENCNGQLKCGSC